MHLATTIVPHIYKMLIFSPRCLASEENILLERKHNGSKLLLELVTQCLHVSSVYLPLSHPVSFSGCAFLSLALSRDPFCLIIPVAYLSDSSIAYILRQCNFLSLKSGITFFLVTSQVRFHLKLDLAFQGVNCFFKILPKCLLH